LSGTEKADRARLVLVTGLSGSGKSTVANCFEDLGYHVVDNLPLPLLERFLEDPIGLTGGRDRIAVVSDLRAGDFALEGPRLWRTIDRRRVAPTLVFLESSDEALVRRFSETRRPHPLGQERSLLEMIRGEREMLADLRGTADLVLDTSEWSAHEMRSVIYRHFGRESGREPDMAVSIVSFGFKHGAPSATDLLLDVRFLANPHYVPELRPLRGDEAPVLAFLDAQPDFGPMVDRFADLMLFLLPRYRQENRSYLTLAIGCTGGRHRSVAVAERLAGRLRAAGWNVDVHHRDVGRAAS
jgi:RNase adapter protein RapZ